MKKNLLSFGLVVLGMSVIAQSPRMSLYEEFSGETCGPCATANPGLNALLHLPQNEAKIIPIKWEVPIPTAPSTAWSLYQTNKTEIDWRYRSTASGGYGYPSQSTSAAAITSGVNSAPSGRIDGQHQWVFGAASDHPSNLSSVHISNAQAIMSPFQVTMLHDWNTNGTALVATVNIVASQNFTSVGNLIFRIVMVEREIHFATPPGGTSEKDFYDPVIKSFPSTQPYGTPMASNWTTGQQMTFTINCTIPSYARNKDQVALVGFVQDDGDRKVHQAVRADKLPLVNDAKAISAFVDVTCGNSISPVIKVENNGVDPISSMTIAPYTDATAAPHFVWNGNLAPGASTIITMASIPSPTTSGAHTFSYNIIAQDAPDFVTTNNTAKVTYMVAGNAQAAPVAEGFLYGAFPPTGWTNINPDNGVGFKRSSVSGGYAMSSNSAMYEFYNNNLIGDKDELILPPMKLDGAEAPEMFFDVAYAQQTGTENDQLDVLASGDCGQTWVQVFTKSGTNLATGAPISGMFTPSAGDWRTEIVDLSAFNSKKVLVKFVVTNDKGSTLYLDNVNLYQKNPTGVNSLSAIKTTVAVYPNPANNATSIKVVSTTQDMANVTVMNMIGEVVYTSDVNVTTGVNTIDLDVKPFASGVYNVVVNVNGSTHTRKLTVTK